jgi:WD40 repeat protein
MSSNSWSADHMPAFRDMAGSTSCARHPVRLSILSSLQAGLLFALLMTFVVLDCGRAPIDQQSPAWTSPTGRTRGVSAAAFAPDGRRLATGGGDGSIVVWEVGKGVEKELSHRPHSLVRCLAFSPDGTSVASGHDNCTVVLWDVTTGKERATLTGHTDTIMCLEFAPDGATLATGAADRSIRLWDVASGSIKATLGGQSGAVCSVRFSPDGRTLASGSATGLVKLRDMANGNCRESLGPSNQGHAVQSLTFSRDGRTLASGGVCDSLKCWDIATGLEKAASRIKVNGIRDVAFSADGQMLIALKYNGDVHLRGHSARSERTICLGNFNNICSAFSTDGLLLASGDIDGTLRIWDLSRAVNGRHEPPVLDR